MIDLATLPHDTAYNKPPFQDLDLSKLGKIREGTPKPIAFTVGLHSILTSEGYTTQIALSHSGELHQINEWNDVVEILCHDWGQHFLYVVYEGWAIDSFLKFLPISALLTLYNTNHLYYDNTQIWYTPGHKLTLLREGREARIQVIGNWSKRLTMRDACRRAGHRFDLEDPLSVAHALKGLGDALLKRAREFLGKQWGDISTPSVLTKQTLSRDLRKVDISQIPTEVLEMAYGCLHAPWIEMLAQGYFPDVYDYDLNSAYPNEIAKLIICDERAGKWVKSSQYVKGHIGEDVVEYGFAQCVIDLKPAPGEVSPIRYRKSTGQLFSPYGTWVANLTKGEIDFIVKHDLGTVDILGGWWFLPTERVHPFLTTVGRLLELRKESKDPVLKAMMKSVAARMNGHFLQKLEVPIFGDDIRIRKSSWIAGPMFNPVYACEVMTQTKLRLAEMSLRAVRQGGKVLAVTVDGLVTDVDLGSGGTDSKLEARSPAVIVAPLVIHMENKDSRYNILRELWNDPGLGKYQFGEARRVHLKEALILGRPELTAKLETTPVNIRVGSDITRIWPELPTRGEHLLERSYYGKQPPIEWCTIGRGEKK